MNCLPGWIHLDRDRAVDPGVCLIGCYLMLSPVWAPSFTREIYDCARLLQLGLLWSLALLMLIPSVAAAITRSWIALSGAARWLVSVFLGIGALSAILSGVRHAGILQIGLMAMLIGLTLFTVAAVRVSRRTSESIFAFCVSAGAALFVLKFWLTYLIFFIEGKAFSWASPFFEFANVRFFAQYQAYALLLVTMPLIVNRLGISWRIFLYFVAASLWSIQWIFNSRALWAGVIAAAAMICLFPTKKRIRWLAEQSLLVLLGGLISLCFQGPGTNENPTAFSIVERSNQSVNERIVLARSVVDMLKESPLVGVGPGQFGMNYSATRAAHPHNTVLQLVAEYGLIAGAAGIALLVSLLIHSIRSLRKKTQSDEDLITAILIAALVMGLSDSVFSGNLTMPHSQVLFFMLAGWIIGRHQAETAVLEIQFAPITRTAVAGVAILAGLLTAILTVEYLHVLGQSYQLIADRVPNFWQFGRFSAW